MSGASELAHLVRDTKDQERRVNLIREKASSARLKSFIPKPPKVLALETLGHNHPLYAQPKPSIKAVVAAGQLLLARRRNIR